MHIALIAGELSGDILGAALVTALRQQFPDARFSGITGPRMVAAGCESVGSIESLSVMGIAEVLPAIPRLLKLRSSLVERYTRERPDVVIGIDAPDFNLGLEKRLKARGIRTVHVVSPSVWAWRQSRIHGIAKSVDLMLCLLPFELAIYQQHGIRAAFIGHPLADQLDATVKPYESRVTLGLPQHLTLTVLPGSRSGEVDKLAIPFAQAAALLHAALPELQCITPVAKASLKPAIEAAIRAHAPKVPWTLLEGQSRSAMQAGDAVLLASGTATLECLLLGRPMVVGYRVSAFTAWLLRGLGLLKVQYVSLPNLLSETAPVPELLQEACNGEALARALRPLLTDEIARLAQTRHFANVRQRLKVNAGEKAAEAIAALLVDQPSNVK